MEELKKECETIAGSWNGKDSGYAEDQAMIANEILEKIGEIENLIKELKETNNK
jgi:hypothetical protein